jgi:glycosyltransferase involved in cell wall biosynthesis
MLVLLSKAWRGWRSDMLGARVSMNMREGSPATTRLLVLADAKGATQAISFLRPLSRQVSEGSCLIEMVDESDVAKLGPPALKSLWQRFAPTALIMSRYAGGLEAPIVAEAHREGVPIIYHIDDNLFSVPEELGPQKFARYNDPKRIAALTAAMTAADRVYASTPELARQLGERLPEARIFAGEIYCAHTCLVKGPSARLTPGRPITVGYMGTSGHARDLDMVVPAIAALLDRHASLRFETFGTIEMPSALTRFGRRIAHHQSVADYDAFIRRLAEIGWEVGIAPLIDSPFNRCKADTKWVEYTAAGIAVVASDLPVYSHACHDGCGLLVGPDGWERAICRLVTDEGARTGMIGTAQQKLAQKYAPCRLDAQLKAMLNIRPAA